MRSRLEPVKAFVAMVKRHWIGILAWHRSHLTTGLLEGTNSLIQAAKARARGGRRRPSPAIGLAQQGLCELILSFQALLRAQLL